MSGNFHALLIGVNCYLPNRMPRGGTYGNLSGCVSDIARVEKYLRTAHQVPAENITRLTSTTGANGLPVEPPAQLPSYDNIVAAFAALAKKAQPGDQVYVHYSGHGGRTTTCIPEVKGAGELDETLVPHDIGNSEARYVRDVELAKLFKDIADTGAFLTVVLDSCHSGGATRGEGGLVARGIEYDEVTVDGRSFDPTVRSTASLAGSHEELAAAWGSPAPGQRGVAPAGGWLQSAQNFTFIAACRANELAWESTFEGTRSGALTYWLLKSLPLLPPGASYQTLQNILLARIRTWKDVQTPQLEGVSDRLVFGSQFATGPSGILLLSVDQLAKTVKLNAGEAHGLGLGTLLAVYPNGSADLIAEEGRLAVVKVTSLVGDTDSIATIVTDFGRGPLEPGAQAVVIGTTDLKVQRAVALTTGTAPFVPALQDALAAEGAGFVRLAAAGESPHFQVAVQDGCYEIWDRAGADIPNAPPVATAEAGAAERVVKRLVHLVKYENVRALENTDPAMTQRVSFRLESGTGGQEGNARIVKEGEEIALIIENKLQPNPANSDDPTKTLNVTVLQMSDDYSIAQVYPEDADFHVLGPQITVPLPFTAQLAEGRTEERLILKVFVTQKTTSFRSLQLPALDEPPMPRTRSFSELDDPLDIFLDSIAGDQAPPEEEVTRRMVLVGAPPQPRPWATNQVEFVIKKA